MTAAGLLLPLLPLFELPALEDLVEVEGALGNEIFEGEDALPGELVPCEELGLAPLEELPLLEVLVDERDVEGLPEVGCVVDLAPLFDLLPLFECELFPILLRPLRLAAKPAKPVGLLPEPLPLPLLPRLFVGGLISARLNSRVALGDCGGSTFTGLLTAAGSFVNTEGPALVGF